MRLRRRRAVELDPTTSAPCRRRFSSYTSVAKSMLPWLWGARAFAINPNDTEFAGEYGFRLALSGQWRSGCRLISQTVERKPDPVGYLETALAMLLYSGRLSGCRALGALG